MTELFGESCDCIGGIKGREHEFGCPARPTTAEPATYDVERVNREWRHFYNTTENPPENLVRKIISALHPNKAVSAAEESEAVVEVVARALARHDNPKHENWWPSYERRARVAITALREQNVQSGGPQCISCGNPRGNRNAICERCQPHSDVTEERK